MKFHTDQSLDLAPESYICIVSFYENAQEVNLRKLIVQNKSTGVINEIILTHGSVVIFSTQTNHIHIHKIILENTTLSSSKWLGITFRQSNQFVRFVQGIPWLVLTNKQLVLANEDKRKLFCKYKGIENQQIDFKYPEINYTLSPSDLMDPITKHEVLSNPPGSN